MTFDPSPLTAFFTTPQGMVLIIATPLLMILLAWFVIASTQAIGYAVRDHDVIVRSGVFWKKQVIQPLRRVQHVEVTNGPLDKRYGLANVILFSAGTNLSTFRLPGLEQADAERIRQFVLDYQLVARGANPSAPESTTA